MGKFLNKVIKVFILFTMSFMVFVAIYSLTEWVCKLVGGKKEDTLEIIFTVYIVNRIYKHIDKRLTDKTNGKH